MVRKGQQMRVDSCGVTPAPAMGEQPAGCVLSLVRRGANHQNSLGLNLLKRTGTPWISYLPVSSQEGDWSRDGHLFKSSVCKIHLDRILNCPCNGLAEVSLSPWLLVCWGGHLLHLILCRVSAEHCKGRSHQ